MQHETVEVLSPQVREKKSNALPVGYEFDEFQIEEVIGEGGFGIVYRATDRLLDRTVAIKEYMPSYLAVRNEDMTLQVRSNRAEKAFTAGLNSFIQEARLLARFNHPGLLHVMRFWEQNGTAYIVTQFCSGTTLKTVLLETPEKISESWIRRFLPPLFHALSTMHKQGYLHCDISLDNIQIQQDATPVLLDFGSARKTIGNISDRTEIMLRPGFAPIEQYAENNEEELGPWTDIYALGAVLHTLVVGSPPLVSVVRSVEESYQPLTQIRPEGYSLPFLHMIDCALRLKPSRRPQTIAQLKALLDRPFMQEDENKPVKQEQVPILPLVSAEKEHTQETLEPVRARTSSQRTHAYQETLIKLRQGVYQKSERVIHHLKHSSHLTRLAGGLCAILFIAGSVYLLTDRSAAEIAKQTASEPLITVGKIEPAKPSATVTPVAIAKPIAHVYFHYAAADSMLINGKAAEPVISGNGFAYVPLSKGLHQLEIKKGNDLWQREVAVNAPGTWIVY